MAQILLSDRVQLEPLSSKFLSERYLGWLNDPEVNRYLDTPAGYTMEMLADYLAIVDRAGMQFWAIVARAANEHIGNIKIDPINNRHLTGEYGILLGDQRYAGKGYAKEASQLVIAHCFETLPLRKITLGVVQDHTTAVQLYTSLGFEQEGLYREHGFYDGQWRNVLRMSLFNPKLNR